VARCLRYACDDGERGDDKQAWARFDREIAEIASQVFDGEGQRDVVATDHAPHTLEEKSQPYPKSPSGLPAVENSLALMLDAASRGECTLEQIVSWMCSAPARIWNIANKGAIREGFDADLVLVDLEKKATILDENQLAKSGWSPWHGVELTGWPVRTWVMGQTVFQDETVDAAHRGREAEYCRT